MHSLKQAMSESFRCVAAPRLSILKMVTPTWLLLILLLLDLPSTAQKLPGIRIPQPGEEKELLNKVSRSPAGIPHIEMLLELGAFYLFLPGEEKEDLKKAMNYIKKAREESLKLNFSDGYIESLQLEGNILIENEQRELSKPILDSAVTLISERLKKKEFANQPEREVRALMQSGKAYHLLLQFDLSEKKFQDALSLSKSKNFPVLHYIFHQLSIVSMWKGDWNKSLFYELEAVRSMESSGDFSSAGSFYFLLGIINRQIGHFQKAVDYYEMAYDFHKKNPSSIIFILCSGISEALTKLDRPKDGIIQLNNKIQFYPPVTEFEKGEVEFSLATCYRVLKNYDSAEVHYLKYMQTQRKDRIEDVALTNKFMGQLYVEWGKYNQAKPYLDKSLASGVFSGRSLSHLYYLLFKSDSAAGNYLAAIDHLMKNKKIDEVLYKEAKTRENQELQIKYETEKKDKDIRIKEQDILLLKRLNELQLQNLGQAELKFRYDSIAKEQNIMLLRAESEKKDKNLLLKQQTFDLMTKKDLLKEAKLQQINFQKNATIAGLFLLFIILILLYNQYRIKQRNNIKINRTNQSLQHLLDEKEWLLKEVHHRVKNNLHTIMSLLETQSAYLKDDALLAVQNSQHRVYAMSLIHQKLYQLENSTNINMAVYLPELISYLSDSYGTGQRIQFKNQIESIQLDISQAIPTGLIINEAITNSIKYAFPNQANGEIYVSMKKTGEKDILLSIADNGIGLPADWSTLQKNSLGMKLMKGLSDDLQATFSIESVNGTNIILQFQKELFLKEN